MGKRVRIHTASCWAISISVAERLSYVCESLRDSQFSFLQLYASATATTFADSNPDFREYHGSEFREQTAVAAVVNLLKSACLPGRNMAAAR